MHTNWWLVIGCGVAGAIYLIYKATRSTTADEIGDSNMPDTIDEALNILYFSTQCEGPILSLLQEYDSRFRRTSGFRDDVVNDAVGGSSSSYHKTGLGEDFGNGSGAYVDVLGAAKYFKTNISRLGDLAPRIRTVIAEATPPHVHVDVYDPDAEAVGTRFLCEPNGDNKFVSLT